MTGMMDGGFATARLSSTDDAYEEPTAEKLDEHREMLLAEWEDVTRNDEVTPYEAHLAHMMAMTLDLVYWVWRRTQPITRFASEKPIKGKRFLS